MSENTRLLQYIITKSGDVSVLDSVAGFCFDGLIMGYCICTSSVNPFAIKSSIGGIGR